MLAEKDELIATLEGDLHEKDRSIQARAQQGQEAENEIQRMRQDQERMRQEMAAKVA